MRIAVLVVACILALAASPPTVRAVDPGDPTVAGPGSEPRAGDGAGLLIPGSEAAAAVVDVADEVALRMIHVSQLLEDNFIELDDVSGATRIENAFNANAGLVNVNQDAGNANNQANVRAFVMGSSVDAVGILRIRVEQTRGGNEIAPNGGSYDDHIVDSFNGGLGIVGVNQSSGSLNQQLNVLVMGAGAAVELPIIEDAELGEVRGTGAPSETQSTQESSIVDSFNDFGGVAQVTQASGNLNNVSNVLAISVSPLPAGGQP